MGIYHVPLSQGESLSPWSAVSNEVHESDGSIVLVVTRCSSCRSSPNWWMPCYFIATPGRWVLWCLFATDTATMMCLRTPLLLYGRWTGRCTFQFSRHIGLCAFRWSVTQYSTNHEYPDSMVISVIHSAGFIPQNLYWSLDYLFISIKLIKKF